VEQTASRKLARPDDAPAGLVEQRVVQVQAHHALRAQRRYRRQRQDAPQRGHAPPPSAHEAVIGVVSAAAVGVDDADDPGDRAPARAGRPAGEQISEDREAGRVNTPAQPASSVSHAAVALAWSSPLLVARAMLTFPSVWSVGSYTDGPLG